MRDIVKKSYILIRFSTCRSTIKNYGQK